MDDCRACDEPEAGRLPTLEPGGLLVLELAGRSGVSAGLAPYDECQGADE